LKNIKEAPFLYTKFCLKRFVRFWIGSHSNTFYGLTGDFIPAGAHIIAIADAFDAMTTGRTYTKPKSADEAIAELKRSSGAQFKLLYVEKFIQALRG
ncbi:MAG: hypothetical protein KKH11_05725, partial [Candidatus Omnitrophica bacterium]|nr:hypothetical protein [Candidatus Omnitrophota bacterium]